MSKEYRNAIKTIKEYVNSYIKNIDIPLEKGDKSTIMIASHKAKKILKALKITFKHEQ